ncbi:hypothetical protein Egran_05957 [Elaphomyces granulatus]|uniref:Ubiquitin-like domain-containing protein n=1 Tax=Elaphomyces granulatus TaxID=519963 RepID=A0A232LQ24_9EURO|nr:hypothetical protein Egran_05957 [Elaphomyces granulatus]
MEISSPFLTAESSSNPLAATGAELFLTVRFSATIPDIQLEISSPSTTTAAGLKQLIRARLPPDLSSHRLRLIYAGRGLEDAVPLAVSLKLMLSPSTSPPRSSTPAASSSSRNINNGTNVVIDKGKKGKTPVRDPPLPHIYVHCSVGDIVLSKSDLATEAAIASTLTLRAQGHHHAAAAAAFESGRGGPSHQRQDDASMTTTPAPRGFDRLLSAGFTPAEVSALRSQFFALQSMSHTPDTMPSAAELRELEDRWMDEGSGAMAVGGGGGGPFGALGGDDDGGFGTGSHGVLDDMLWGAVMGFFWPIGCAMWLRREEGVWSWRKGLAVFVGVVVNAAFGAMRVMN